MLLIHETITNDYIAGPGNRQILLKRFFFREHGRLYVYTSSMPELEQSEDSIVEDTERYCVLFQIQCLWRTQKDVHMT